MRPSRSRARYLAGTGSSTIFISHPAGEIILVETKLWRNLQARREAVAQALDYVSALMKLGYEGFERAVASALPYVPATSLYAAVAAHPEAVTEREFIDAVSRNLARGRLLVLVVGDGIRQEAEALASLVQGHPGAHFTFALVELATWCNASSGEVVVLPNTLARTVMIERGILRFEAGQPVIDAPAAAVEPARPKTISEELFFEELAGKDAGLPEILKKFLARVAPLGVYPDFQACLNLKADLPFHSRATNFGYITKAGKFSSDRLSWTVPRELALAYDESLRILIRGTIIETPRGAISLTTNGTSMPAISDLLPAYADAWYEAIARVVRGSSSAPPIE